MLHERLGHCKRAGDSPKSQSVQYRLVGFQLPAQPCEPASALLRARPGPITVIRSAFGVFVEYRQQIARLFGTSGGFGFCRRRLQNRLGRATKVEGSHLR